MTLVSVIIPTFRRPDSLLRAARSVLSQRGAGDFEIVVVDNSPEASASAAFRILQAEARVLVRWVHEPRPGVAHARNAGVKAARGDLIAWLDDDEEAPPHWLAALIAVRKQTGAQSVFGPVRARVAGEPTNAEFFETLYTRTGPATSGPVTQSYGIGNSLQPRAMFDEDAPFDAAANQRGGEDDALFAAWSAAGAQYAWAADAWVIEHVGPDRTRLAHGLKRAFAYGQGPCETAFAARKFATLVRHMGIGAAQAVTYATASAIVLAGSTPRALALLDLAARGAGKVFWFMEQRFYGEALVRQPT